MKLTVLFLTIGLFSVSAKGISQSVTLNANNLPLEKVFQEVKKQTGYLFFYDAEILKTAKPVSISVVDRPIKDFLEQLFSNQQLEFRIRKKAIIVTAAANSTAVTSSATIPPIDIKGRITNEAGEAVAGLSVVVKGSNYGTTTNNNGEFTMINVDSKAFLVISGTNVETVEIAVENRTLLLLTVKTKVSPLDEVQIIAYGTTSRRLTTGNVTTVKAEDITKQPVSNPLLALQGRVPGMTIDQSTGIPGSGVIIRIQGINSINGGNNPLFVIDGIPYRGKSLPNLAGILGGNDGGPEPNGTGSPLSFLNPADIESVDILKDADATAIYGSRAANGAVLITTKKGKAGATKVDLNLQSGWGKIARALDVLSTTQYIEMRRQAIKNDGIEIGPTDYDLNGTWDTTRNTNWQKELINNSAQYSDAQLSISGGNVNTQFLIGGGYHRETTIFPGNFRDQKGSMHINVSHTTTNQRFRIFADVKYLSDNNTLPATDLTQTAITLAPNAPALYNADGTLNWQQLSNGTSTWKNPLAYLDGKYSSKNKNLLANAELSYLLFKGLELKSTFGYNSLITDEIVTTPSTTYAPERRTIDPRLARFQNGGVNTWIIEPQLNYKKTINRGILSVLLGATFQESGNKTLGFLAFGQTTDNRLEDITMAPTLRVSSNLNSNYKYNALFGSLNYNLDNRYIVNLTARRDGSSRFGSENLFHNFGSIGGAWLFSNEKFIQNVFRFVNFGKLKASYGTTGSDQIGDYQFMSLYGTYGVPVPYQQTVGIIPQGLPNPNLQWEETKKLNVGLDLAFLKEKIVLGVNYFRNRSSNQLVPLTLPQMVGRNGISTNLPATVQNTGWEFSLQSEIIKVRSFNWNTSINVTVQRNKLVSYPNIEDDINANYFYTVGYPINIKKSYHYIGVNEQTGLYTVADSKGEPVQLPDSETDRTVLLDVNPKFTGGLLNTVSYQGVQLDFLFQFAKQVAANYFYGRRPGFFVSNYQYSAIGNQPAWVMDSPWRSPGDISDVQQFSATYPSDVATAYSNATQSDAAITDASYIRLKNVSLTWQIPHPWYSKLKIQSCRLYAHAQNLLTITNFKGSDPESRNVYAVPPLKVITFGLQVTL